MRHNPKYNSRLFHKLRKVGLFALSTLAALSIWLLALYSLNFV